MVTILQILEHEIPLQEVCLHSDVEKVCRSSSLPDALV